MTNVFSRKKESSEKPFYLKKTNLPFFEIKKNILPVPGGFYSGGG